MGSRRAFLGAVIGGATSVAVSGQAGARQVQGANDRIRFGLIGAGGRGKEIIQAALRCPNVEAAGVADIYPRRFGEAKKLAPSVKTYNDHRKLLDQKDLDAVLIATPQHLHAIHFVNAIQASKDVYQEKTMAFSPAHARRMRKALDGSGRVVQVGMQMNSGLGIQKVRELARPEHMGTITALQAHHFRNAPYGGWLRAIPDDCTPEHVDWAAFEGESRSRPFDPMRFINWRFYWDYSGGNVFENMVHQVAFWYGALGLSIPETVTMTGANYRSPKMQVPDTMNVVMNQPEKLLFTWSSMFGNDYYGETNDLLFGTKGTLVHTASDQVRHHAHGGGQGRSAHESENEEYLEFTDTHMQNFFDCVRSRKETNCPFELGFRTAIACQMAITSYRRQATVRWDAQTEEIV
jgi:predicted dehydrogenase